MATEFAKKHIDFHGLDIGIEWAKGDIKPKAWNADGTPDESAGGYELLADYGFFPGTISGEEADDLDVFVGPDKDSLKVYVACLTDGVGGPMEDKVLLGFPDEVAATALITAQYGEDPVSLVYAMPWADLQALVATGDVGRQDAARRFHAKAEEMNELYGKRDEINDAQRAMADLPGAMSGGLHAPVAPEVKDPGLPVLGDTSPRSWNLGTVGNEPSLILLLEEE